MSRVPDILVERLALGELPPDKAAEVQARLAAAGELDRLTALAADNAQILDQYPPHLVATHITHKATPPPTRRWLAIPALVAAAALAVFLVAPPATLAPDLTPTGNYTGFKGDLKLDVFAIAGPEAALLPDGVTQPAGALLQLRYTVPPSVADLEGAVLSLDGRGVVTRHFAGPLEAGVHTLPQSYQLDDAPDFERFYLFAAEALDVAAMEAALAAGSEPAEVVSVFTVRKGSVP